MRRKKAKGKKRKSIDDGTHIKEAKKEEEQKRSILC
jgi:hypothetical protein